MFVQENRHKFKTIQPISFCIQSAHRKGGSRNDEYNHKIFLWQSATTGLGAFMWYKYIYMGKESFKMKETIRQMSWGDPPVGEV